MLKFKRLNATTYAKDNDVNYLMVDMLRQTTIGERFVAIMHLQAKQFKTHTGAVRWLNKLGYK